MDRSEFEPGQYVRHSSRPEWGLGQVQSAVGHRVTVNFEHVGKVLVNTGVAGLEHAEPEQLQKDRISPK